MLQKGFSLIELVVALGIISVLITFATLSFNQWTHKQNIEKEVKQMYADMMTMRQQAMVTGMTHDVQFPNTKNISFRRYSSEGDVLGLQVGKAALPYPVLVSNTNPIEFNQRGLMADPIDKVICVFSDVEPSVDSLVITQSRISMGKIKNQGSKDAAACKKSNIEFK
jgi:prepilin-type N-terminal cleavage/methylation domain-containing protein